MKLTTDECPECGAIMTLDPANNPPIFECLSCHEFWIGLTLKMARECGRIEVEADDPVDAINCAILREYYKARAKQYDLACREWCEENEGITVDGETLDLQNSTRTTYPAEPVMNLLADAGVDPRDLGKLVKIKNQKDLKYLVKEKMGNPTIYERRTDGFEGDAQLWHAVERLKITTDSERFDWKKLKGDD